MEVGRILKARGILNEDGTEGQYEFFVSDLGEKFEELGGRFLGREIKCARKIDIEKF